MEEFGSMEKTQINGTNPSVAVYGLMVSAQ
jgi:hypothetical protein